MGSSVGASRLDPLRGFALLQLHNVCRVAHALVVDASAAARRYVADAVYREMLRAVAANHLDGRGIGFSVKLVQSRLELRALSHSLLEGVGNGFLVTLIGGFLALHACEQESQG